MLEGINVEEIKKYNETLRAHNERAAKIQAEINFNTTELNNLCAELSAELGFQVTIENLETIYNDRVAKINDTLKTGTEILKRIAEEEAAANAASTNNTLGAVGVMGAAPQQAPNINGMTMPLGPIGTVGTPAQQTVFNQGNTNNMFSGLDGGKEMFGETPARPTFPGESIKI